VTFGEAAEALEEGGTGSVWEEAEDILATVTGQSGRSMDISKVPATQRMGLYGGSLAPDIPRAS